jgi:hypothetical protein
MNIYFSNLGGHGATPRASRSSLWAFHAHVRNAAGLVKSGGRFVVIFCQLALQAQLVAGIPAAHVA